MKDSQANTAPTQQNKRDRAVALQYNDIETLPRVIASGAGDLARRIVELAKASDVPIQKNEALTDVLKDVQVGAYINKESFRLVAEIISFLFHHDMQWQEKHKQLDIK